MQTIDTLKGEHDAVLGVLALLEQATGAAERGAPVPKDVFTDVGAFFSVFVDRCHHGKEEGELFPRLTSPEGVALVQRLEAQHVDGRRLVEAYVAAVNGYQPGDSVSGARLAGAARAYTAFLREHIDLENRELLPAIAALAPHDRDLIEAFERIEIEKIGPGVHERLHGMLDGLPARITPWLAPAR
ncbi:MAG: hemerythrin domain-containing protein [Chloroflexi bacterium]|nr:hemerythrin domain-containing protein [Chloroflexota bacterium]